MRWRPGVILDREMDGPHNENGAAVLSFGVAATDQGIPPRTAQTTVSQHN